MATEANNKDVSLEVEAYIAAAPEDMREALQRLRQVIKAAAPEAVEVIGYGIPGFKYRGRPLVYLGVAKKHYGLYGEIPAALSADDLQGFDTDKGTIRFPSDRPVPEALVQKVVLARIEEIDAAETAKMTSRRKAAG